MDRLHFISVITSKNVEPKPSCKDATGRMSEPNLESDDLLSSCKHVAIYSHPATEGVVDTRVDTGGSFIDYSSQSQTTTITSKQSIHLLLTHWRRHLVKETLSLQVILRKNSAAVAMAPPVMAPRNTRSVPGLLSVRESAAPVRAPESRAFFQS